MKMNLAFYGTGGADGLPNPFCRCEACSSARSAGGKDRRRRSALRVNEEILIDFGPDMASQAAEFGDLYGLKHVLVTHTHEDHFYYALAETRAFAKQRGADPLNIYLTDGAFELVETLRKSNAFMGGKLGRYEERDVVRFHKLEFGQAVRIGGVEVIPLKGNHAGNFGENPANYLITLEDRRNLYYALDTGYFLPETINSLKDHRLDILITECTYGNRTDRGDKPNFHLDLKNCTTLFDELYESNIIHNGTKIYLTHISHHNTAPHAKLDAMARCIDRPYSVKVAYDGMVIID